MSAFELSIDAIAVKTIIAMLCVKKGLIHDWIMKLYVSNCSTHEYYMNREKTDALQATFSPQKRKTRGGEKKTPECS